MTPTNDLRGRLRKLLNEVIPPGGTESDTNFFDVDLDELLIEAVSIYGAAAAGWTMKAGMLQEQLERYSAGQEQYNITTLKDKISHALAMADRYAKMSSTSVGSLILKAVPPEVL